MSFSRPPRRIVIAVLVLLGACAEPTSTSLRPPDDASYAKSAAASTSPTVTTTTPAEAPRDTTLDVQINGSGFDKGSIAAFTLGGVPDGRVRVNSTRYVKSSQVVANVTIAADAVPSLYDVAVTTSGGKKGIGTELFMVELKGELLAGGGIGSGVNALGDVAGWAGVSSSCPVGSVGYVWHLDGSRADLPPAQGFCGVMTKDINGSGVVLAALFGGAPGASGLWTPNGSGYTAQTLSPTSDGIYPTASALNDAGEVIGWIKGSSRIFWRSSTTGWLPMSAPAGATACLLKGLNNLGAIVGSCSNAGAAYEAYYWFDHNATPVKLPRPTPTGDVVPNGINDDGVIVGQAGSAVKWTPASGGFSASILPDLGAGGIAAAIASDGSIVGLVRRNGAFPRPALWSPDGRLSILETQKGAEGEALKVSLTSNGIVIAGDQHLNDGNHTMRWRAPQ